MEETSWDAVVIGGGAAGLSAAVTLGRARRRVLVIDASSPRNRFASQVHGILGNEGISPTELLVRGRTEAAGYGVAFVEGAADRVDDLDTGIGILCGSDIERARTVIVATGVSDGLPPIAGLAQRWGRSVLHCPYCHGWEVRGQRLGVLVTSPLGVHQAELVRQWSDRVVVFAAAEAVDPAAERRLRARKVELVREDIVELVGTDDRLDGVRTGDGRLTPLDALFTVGVPQPHDAFLAGLGLKRAEGPMGSFLAVDPAGRTSHDRIWAAGNVVNPAANVAMSISAGAVAAASVNQALVEADFDAAAS
jgi:thioredoxin reductase